MKIAQLLVNLRFEMISTMCCILRYALDLSSNFSVVLTIASEQNRYFVKQLKQVMLTFVWDLFTLFTSVGIMARTFKVAILFQQYEIYKTFSIICRIICVQLLLWLT